MSTITKAQFGVATETTYGTPVTVSRFLPFDSESFKLNKTFIESRSLRAGRAWQASGLTIGTTRDVNGGWTMPVYNKGMGMLFNQLHGLTVVPVVNGATAAYTQTHDIGTSDPSSKSFTAQFNKSTVADASQAFTYKGAKVDSVTFSVDTGGLLMSTWTCDARDEDTTIALATAAYPTGLVPFTFQQGTVTVGGVAAGSVIATGTSVGLTIPYKTDRYYLGNTGLKAQPLTNDLLSCDVTLTVDFADLNLYNLFTAGTIASVTLTFVGANIASTFYETFTISMPACQFRGDTPTIDGPDVLNQSIPIKVLDNGTNAPVTLTYTSVDTTL